jgi:hypothetical protein
MNQKNPGPCCPNHPNAGINAGTVQVILDGLNRKAVPVIYCPECGAILGVIPPNYRDYPMSI